MTQSLIPEWLSVLAVVTSLASLLLALALTFGYRRALRRILGIASEPELRHAMLAASTEIAPLAARVSALETLSARLAEAGARTLLAPGVVHFQAFDGDGPALSFSVALLNDQSDGVILTSLHARDQVRLYAKAVVRGKPALPLSEDESRAMQLVLAPDSAPQPERQSRRRSLR